MSDLRPYQRDAVDAIIEELSKNDRTTAVMACGSGKTWTAIAVIEEMIQEDGLVSVLVPSLALMQQWYLHLSTRLSGAAFLGVCSDDELRSDSSEVTAETTTDASVVEKFVQQKSNGIRVVLSTYHSSRLLGGALISAGERFDLVISDEAHRTAGKHDANFATVLFDSRFPASKRLFLTATPRVRLNSQTSDGSKMMSMAETKFYGERAFTYTFGTAIEQGYLSDYRVVVMLVSDEQVHKQILDNQGVLVDGEAFNVGSLASCLALDRLKSEFDVRSVIVFHNTVSSSRAFVTNMKHFNMVDSTANRPTMYHLDGLTPQSGREAAIRALGNPPENGWTVASNVRILTEGVDVPSIDSVMFAEPKTSQVDVVQAIGRALRKSDRDQESLILIPAYIAPGESPDHVLAGSDFRHIWQVINAIRDHDRALDQEIDSIRRNDYDPTAPRYEANVLPERIVITGIESDLERYRDAISTLILDRVTTNKSVGLDEFAAWMQTHDSPDVPVKYVNPDNGFPLGQWVQSQRQAYRWDRLDPEEIAALEQVGFSWGNRSKRWRTMMDRATKYIMLANVDRLIAREIPQYDQEMYRWLNEQRLRSEKGNMPKAERRELDSAFLHWSDEETRDDVNRAVSALNKYLSKKKRARNVLDPTKMGRDLAQHIHLVCNNYYLLDPADHARFKDHGLMLSTPVKLDFDDAGWEELFLSIIHKQYQPDGVIFHATDRLTRVKMGSSGNGKSLDPNSMKVYRKEEKAQYDKVSDIPHIGMRTVMGHQNIITDEYIAYSELAERQVRTYASEAINHAYQLRYGDDLRDEYVVLEDFRVMRAKLPVQDKGSWVSSGKLNDHLDEFVFFIQIDSEPEKEKTTREQLRWYLGDSDVLDFLSDEEIEAFRERLFEDYSSILNEALKGTVKYDFPKVKVRTFQSQSDMIQYVDRHRKHRMISYLQGKFAESVVNAIQSESKRHIGIIIKEMLKYLT